MFTLPSLSGMVTLRVWFCWRRKDHIRNFFLYLKVFFRFSGKNWVEPLRFHIVKNENSDLDLSFSTKSLFKELTLYVFLLHDLQMSLKLSFGKLTSFDSSSYRRQRSLAAKRVQQQSIYHEDVGLMKGSYLCGDSVVEKKKNHPLVTLYYTLYPWCYFILLMTSNAKVKD